MTTTQIKEFLKEDLEYKKTYNAYKDTPCDGCNDWIEEDDEFIYLGDGKKVCNNCQKEIINFIENS